MSSLPTCFRLNSEYFKPFIPPLLRSSTKDVPPKLGSCINEFSLPFITISLILFDVSSLSNLSSGLDSTPITFTFADRSFILLKLVSSTSKLATLSSKAFTLMNSPLGPSTPTSPSSFLIRFGFILASKKALDSGSLSKAKPNPPEVCAPPSTLLPN